MKTRLTLPSNPPASTDYLAATCVGLFVKLGGRFSRKAGSSSLASAELTRSMNSWFSLFTASSSWPIKACLMSRLLASNALPGFAAGDAIPAVHDARPAYDVRTCRRGDVRAGLAKVRDNGFTDSFGRACDKRPKAL